MDYFLYTPLAKSRSQRPKKRDLLLARPTSRVPADRLPGQLAGKPGQTASQTLDTRSWSLILNRHFGLDGRINGRSGGFGRFWPFDGRFGSRNPSGQPRFLPGFRFPCRTPQTDPSRPLSSPKQPSIGRLNNQNFWHFPDFLVRTPRGAGNYLRLGIAPQQVWLQPPIAR